MTQTIQPFDFSVDVLRSILWQYNTAPHIQALVQNKQDFLDVNQTAFWTDFYTNIFNLETANDFGLAVWAIILDAPIAYSVTSGGSPSWGFGTHHVNFTNGNFAPNSGIPITYTLSTETARVILMLRYYQLTGCCTIPAMNRMCADVFKEYGKAWVADGDNMAQEYVLQFVPPSDMQFAFNNYDVLPRPAGVGSGWRIYIEPPFGLNADATNFDHGNFNDE